MKKLSIDKIIGSLLFAFGIAFFYYYCIRANTDLTAGRHVLFVDEQIIFDNVRRILHPKGFGDLRWNLLDGNDHRYGRILYTLTAMASFIPDRIWGLPGMIVSSRMFLATMLLASYLILLRTFVQSWTLRGLGLLALITLPFSSYYATMPKPEPIELFFLALFAHQFMKRSYEFGAYWILLGLAFGSKISVLPIIPVFFAISITTFALNSGIIALRTANFARQIIVASASALVGLVIAVPILVREGGVKTWLSWTFLNTGHGNDDSSTTARDWLLHIKTEYFAHPLLIIAVTTLAFATVVALISRAMEKQISLKRIFSQVLSPILPILLGLGLALPIILFVKRVWGLYLHPGMALVTVGVFAVADGLLKSKDHLVHRTLAAVTICLIVINTSFFRLTKTRSSYLTLSQRTQEPKYLEQIRIYEYLRKTMLATSQELARPVTVMLDPMIFNPESNSDFTVLNFWGPFSSWKDKADLVIARSVAFGDPTAELPPKTWADFRSYEKAQEEFLIHVASLGHDCKQAPCYVPLCAGIDQVRFYIRSDLTETDFFRKSCSSSAVEGSSQI